MAIQRSISIYNIAFYALLVFLLNSCSSPKGASSAQTSTEGHRFLLRDEGLSQLSLVDEAKPQNNWYLPIPAGRDLQLIGNDKVLIGTGVGYEEREIATGQKVFEQTGFNGTVAARRLRNGNTLLTGVNWRDQKGIVLVEIDGKGAVQKQVLFPGFDYVRLVRQTPSGTYLVTSNNLVFEGDETGKIIWQAKINTHPNPHVWQAVRLKNGNTLLAGGFAANFHLFGKDGKPVDSIGGPTNVRPYFFSGFQIMRDGNIVVANWQGHGAGHGGSGQQIVAYKPNGDLAWTWQQDSTKFSSIQGVIVLDGLDTRYLHVEDEDGKLAPVK